MATERDFETAIAKYPDLIEEGLRLIGRQQVVHGRRMDLLFEDHLGDQLVLELKWGPIKDKDIGQIMAYEGWLVSDRPVRVMLIGTRVPPNIQASLDYHGIAWREITPSEVRKFLREKGDEGLLKSFDDRTPLDPSAATHIGLDASEAGGTHKRPSKSSQVRKEGGPAALFAPVEGKWLDKARQYFDAGNNVLYFYTNASIGQAAELNIHNVYFKEKGNIAVTAQADFVELRMEDPVEKRLPDSAGTTGRFYYGFRNLRQIDPIQLSELRYYNTDMPLQNDVPGARIIKQP